MVGQMIALIKIKYIGNDNVELSIGAIHHWVETENPFYLGWEGFCPFLDDCFPLLLFQATLKASSLGFLMGHPKWWGLE